MSSPATTGPVQRGELEPLHYASHDPRAGRRRAARRVVLVLVLVATAWLGYQTWTHRNSIAANWRAWLDQRAWARNPAPVLPSPGKLVFRDGRVHDLSHFPETVVAYSPNRGEVDRSAGPTSATMQRSTQATVYGGHARADDGTPCFVVIEVKKVDADLRDYFGSPVVMAVKIYSQARPWRATSQFGGATVGIAGREHFQVYRPMRDPDDPSHLTFLTRANGEDRWFDIWITRGGLTAKIEPRQHHPQLSPPSTSPN